MRPLSLIEIWQHFTGVVWRKRTDDIWEPIMNTEADLQRRIKELLEANDLLTADLVAKDRAIIVLAERIAELEEFEGRAQVRAELRNEDH